MVDDGKGVCVLNYPQLTFVCPSLVAGVAMNRPLDLEVIVTEVEEADAPPPRTLTTHRTVTPTCPSMDTFCPH